MPKDKSAEKIVIAHRGASGYLPEHTMESKAMAFAMGPDYIEQDLVLSKDDVPIVIHDIYLEEVTDVKNRFPERKRPDGRYYVIDFTLDELKTLYVYERIDLNTQKAVFPDRYPLEEPKFRLHTLSEEISMIQGLNKSTGKNIGIYPEIKNPGFHNEHGKDISSIVLKVLDSFGYSKRSDNCILQCFDAVELRRIREELHTQLFLTQLIELPEGFENLETYSSYANAIGPSIEQLILYAHGKSDSEKKSLIQRSRDLNLKIHAYTFRKDEHPNFETFENLLNFAFKDLEIDGGFTDFPDVVQEYFKK
ncbi:MAG: glycerophosphodiester phosphodiesterase [Flavobacteriaceae bacterium]|nr:MAG: glycerophosphodiester phosphodiesterase [Flavobacteriaceae bacterium]